MMLGFCNEIWEGSSKLSSIIKRVSSGIKNKRSF
jgi:hypothetical protein